MKTIGQWLDEHGGRDLALAKAGVLDLPYKRAHLSSCPGSACLIMQIGGDDGGTVLVTFELEDPALAPVRLVADFHAQALWDRQGLEALSEKKTWVDHVKERGPRPHAVLRLVQCT